MPKTLANPIALGTAAADFALPDAGGRIHRLTDFAARPALLVAFLSNRCPFVLLIRESFADFTREYAAKGLQVIGINSNDPQAHSEETPERLGEEADRFGYAFPYLKDASQEVAKRFGAACTPELFLFDGRRRLSYHGQFDDARPGNGLPATGADLRAAADAVLAGRQPSVLQVPAIGCNIKWTPGNEPEAFVRAA